MESRHATEYGRRRMLPKRTQCMAISPETTNVSNSKQPIWKLMPGSTSPIVKELVLKFEDDEDDLLDRRHITVFRVDENNVDLTQSNSGTTNNSISSSNKE
eukprot:scaffold5373_cov39-Attheya_sp.AAC.3